MCVFPFQSRGLCLADIRWGAITLGRRAILHILPLGVLGLICCMLFSSSATKSTERGGDNFIQLG